MPTELDSKHLQPFVAISQTLTDDFKKLCAELLFYLREYGISQLKPSLGNPQEVLRFAALVHEGWKKAQSIIAREALARLDKVESLKAGLQGLRKGEVKKARQIDLHKANVEIIILRRMVDSIVWNVLGGEHSTIRRLPVQDGQHNFSVANIRNAQAEVDKINEDPHSIAIASDLTTFVHVGDIFHYNYIEGNYRLIELKEGKKNVLFAEVAQHTLETGSTDAENKLKESFKKHDEKHYARVKKQVERGFAVAQVINNEGGWDQFSNMQVKIHKTPVPLHRYSDRIIKCYDELNSKDLGEKNWAIDSIDNCLHIGLYRKTEYAYVGFKSWMHKIDCKSPIYNICDSFRSFPTTPLPSLDLPTEVVRELLCGNLILIQCLDLQRFVDESNKAFPGLFAFASEKETKKAIQHQQQVEIPHLNYKGIRDEGGGFIGQGFVDRMIFDLQTPASAVSMLYQMNQTSKLKEEPKT